MTIKYIDRETTTLWRDASLKKRRIDLLWGDRVRVLGTAGAYSQVYTRGRTGFVETAHLSDNSLLEIYFIDVGQGDGILIRTPDHRHIMIDGGYKRASLPTGKNAADFVDWKFAKDYEETSVRLDAMLASHCDADHYGGLWDLLNPAQRSELACKNVTVEAFYHAGVGWWKDTSTQKRGLGPTTHDGRFLLQLMEDRDQILNALRKNASPALQGEWASFLRSLMATTNAAGNPTPCQRLSHADNVLPGFDGTSGSVAIQVLAPVEFSVGGTAALHNFSSSPDKNTNGNSLLLRLDYGKARILLTGDLNTLSQQTLLDDYAGQHHVFSCDVAKACHHGSSDVSLEFLRTMCPAVTVISSGDSEGHDHPQASIVAASAITGYQQTSGDSLISPLVYSTELARSTTLTKASKATLQRTSGNIELPSKDLSQLNVEFSVVKAGSLQGKRTSRTLDQLFLAADLVYGLVNVRTDGTRILCATMNEKDHSWNTRWVDARH
jgi:beta-lactamase superfamily II metal-dependent hydrolase